MFLKLKKLLISRTGITDSSYSLFNIVTKINSAIKEYLIGKMTRIYRRNRFELLKPLTKYLTSNWFLKRSFIDITNYEKLYKDKVCIIIKRPVSLNYSSVVFFDEISEIPLKQIEASEYVAILKNVEIIGGSNLVILDQEFVLYDLKHQNLSENIDYSDEGIVHHKNNECVILANYATTSFKTGIFFGGNYSSNYYHLLYEFLVKFKTLNGLDIEKKVPLFVDEINFRIPQYKELLNYLNVDKREIIPIEKKDIYLVEELVHIPSPNFIPPNYIDITKIDASSCLFDPSSLLYLREVLLPFKSNTGKFGKKIFISRKDASGRRDYNEEEVYNMLTLYGFSLCQPEKYSVAEQIEIFNNAEIIVGATGAAFSNILFCNPQCKVFCLTNYKIDLSIFSTIAKIINLEMIYFYDKSTTLSRSSDLHASFKVDVSALEVFIKN